MRLGVGSGHWFAVSRIALVGLIGSAAAACSSDTMRLSENPFSNPFASSERVAPGTPTASQPAPSQASAPMATAQVQSQSLPPIQPQPAAQPARYAAPAPMTARPAPVKQTTIAQPAGQPKFRLVDTSRTPAPAPAASADSSKRLRPGTASTAQASPAPVKQTPIKQASGKPAAVQVASA